MFLEKTQRKNRSRAFTRHQRRRNINKKLHILKNIKLYESDFFNDKKVGKLNKGKVHCSCNMCKYEKHMNIEKDKYKLKNNFISNEIDECFEADYDM